MRHTVARTARSIDAGEGRLREPVQADAAAAGTSAHATVAATMHRVRCRAMGWGDWTFADDALIRSDPRILPDSREEGHPDAPGISDRVGRIEP